MTLSSHSMSVLEVLDSQDRQGGCSTRGCNHVTLLIRIVRFAALDWLLVVFSPIKESI